MENTQNNTKKYVVLATYVVAVLCLLAGLFLPLFNGKNILALQLADVFKSLLNKESQFAYSYPVYLFGIEKLHFDFTALVIVLYAVVTALALLSFIPVAFSVRKEGRAAKKFYYAVEACAVIVLALFLIVALQAGQTDYNFVVAIGGTVLALLVLCVADKGKASALKIIFFLLSAIGFLALFSVELLSEDLGARLDGKFTSAMTGTSIGASYLAGLFVSKISQVLSLVSDVKSKILIIAGAATATLVLLNFIIDTVKLGTGKDGKVRNVFNIARYGVEFICAVCVLVLALICKQNLGVMLIAIIAVSAIALAIVIVRFVLSILRKPAQDDVTESNEITVNEVTDIDDMPALLDGGSTDSYTQPFGGAYGDEDYADDDGYVSPEQDEYVQPAQEDEYVSPEEDDGYVSPEQDEYVQPVQEDEYVSPEEDAKQTVEQPVEETVVEEPATAEAESLTAEEEVEDYEIKTDGTYLLPEDENIDEQPEETQLPDEQPAEEAVVEEPAEEPVAEQPVQEVQAEPEVRPEVSESRPQETAQRPYREEIKPYNPYERHSNNPFRNFEQSSQPIQPYNPYAQHTAERSEKPVQNERSLTSETPAQPARPAYEPKPAQTYKTYDHTGERPVRPLRPRPIIQEFKPVPPISEQPPKERTVYTIDAIYAGPVDDFIRKLTNDERIEFARTFIEKSRGDLGNIPDYAVGGDNKKFFSVVFIYLGRIRGLVSDGLLNKMYKELNML